MPTLALSWAGTRSVGGVSVVVDEGGSATAPLRLRVVLGGQEQVVELQEFGRDGNHVTLAAGWPPVAAQAIEISFVDVEPVASQRVSGELVRMPVGLAELSVPGISDLLAPLRGSSPVVLDCSAAAATIEVDGRSVALQGSLTRRDAVRGAPADLTLCPTTKARLAFAWSAGRHRVVAGPGLDVRSLALAPPGGALARQPERRVEIGRWTAESRSLSVSAGPQAVLSVAENANDGWRATADGTVLTPVRVEGWKQGWVLPASGTTTVELSYVPGTRYRAALAAGLAGVLLLVLLVAWPARSAWRPVPVTLHGRSGRPFGSHPACAAGVVVAPVPRTGRARGGARTRCAVRGQAANPATDLAAGVRRPRALRGGDSSPPGLGSPVARTGVRHRSRAGDGQPRGTGRGTGRDGGAPDVSRRPDRVTGCSTSRCSSSDSEIVIAVVTAATRAATQGPPSKRSAGRTR